MTLVLLVPVLLLAAAVFVLVGPDRSRHTRAKMAAYPIGVAFLGAVGTLYQVAAAVPLSFGSTISRPSPPSPSLSGSTWTG